METSSGVKRKPTSIDRSMGRAESTTAGYWDSVMDPDWWFVDDKGMMVHKGMFSSPKMAKEKRKYPHIFKKKL